jgi:hypothetical protein
MKGFYSQLSCCIVPPSYIVLATGSTTVANIMPVCFKIFKECEVTNMAYVLPSVGNVDYLKLALDEIEVQAPTAYINNMKYSMGRVHVRRATKPPKGFDISLDEIIEKFLISRKDIDRLIEINKCCEDIAVCRTGNEYFYRESQIEKLFRRR